MSGPAPFGMRRRDGDGELIPDLGETAVVRELVQAFVGCGGRAKATAVALNDKGHRTRRGARWSDTAVNRVLSNRALEQLLPKDLWRRCKDMLAGSTPGQAPRRRSVHPLGGITHCQCEGKMYLRDAGPSGKYICRDCRAKIPQDALETLFSKSLESVELQAAEIVAALEDNPRAAELTRMLGGRDVKVSAVWPLLDQPGRCQLVDLLVARIVVSPDEVSVVLADSGDSEAKTAPSPPNPLPSSHGSMSMTDHATSRENGTSSKDLPPVLTVEEVAAVLRTTRKAVYAMAERGALPGVIRLGRRLLVRRNDLLRWMGENRAPSPR